MAQELWENYKEKLLIPRVREAVTALVARGATDGQIAAHFEISRVTAAKVRSAAGLERVSKEKTRRVQIRIPESLLQDLTREAASTNTALSDVIRRRCSAAG